MQLIQIDPFCAIVAAVAIWLSYKALQEQSRKDTCFRLLELWSSEFYRKCRNEAWYKLDAELAQGAGSRDLIALQASDPDFDTKLWTVLHFFEHLTALFAHDALDVRLGKALFSNDAIYWYRTLPNSQVFWGRYYDTAWKQTLEPLLDYLEIRQAVESARQ